MPRTTRLMSSADIARELGVPPAQVRMWRARYRPGRSKAETAVAPPFPEPDAWIGETGVPGPQSGAIPGWKASRMDEIRAWRDLIPSDGTRRRTPRGKTSR